MNLRAQEIESAALELPVHEGARLAERLLASLDEDADVEQAWAEETTRRHAEYWSGKVTPIPRAEVFTEAQRRIGR